MRQRHWKRLLAGWVLVGMLLSTPALAQYTYYYWDYYPSYGYGGSSDDDFELKPWMILAGVGYSLLSMGGLEGCAQGQPNAGSP